MTTAAGSAEDVSQEAFRQVMAAVAAPVAVVTATDGARHAKAAVPHILAGARWGAVTFTSSRRSAALRPTPTPRIRTGRRRSGSLVRASAVVAYSDSVN